MRLRDLTSIQRNRFSYCDTQDEILELATAEGIDTNDKDLQNMLKHARAVHKPCPNCHNSVKFNIETLQYECTQCGHVFK